MADIHGMSKWSVYLAHVIVNTEGEGFWPILQPATKWQSRCYSFIWGKVFYCVYYRMCLKSIEANCWPVLANMKQSHPICYLTAGKNVFTDKEGLKVSLSRQPIFTGQFSSIARSLSMWNKLLKWLADRPKELVSGPADKTKSLLSYAFMLNKFTTDWCFIYCYCLKSVTCVLFPMTCCSGSCNWK